VNRSRRLRLAADETGQVILLALVAMVVLIAMVGFAVDVGRAYLVQRQLQAGVDAAALAGAQHLPEPAPTTDAAMEYGPSPGEKNALTSVDNAETTVTMRCVRGAPGCSSVFDTYNAVRVSAKSNVPTVFARVIGIDKLTVTASATACSPCSAKDLDIVVVLDRTGSMCMTSNGSDDQPQCTDLANAKQGIRTFLGFMDPELDHVGLTVFPPALDRNSACDMPTAAAKRYGYNAWWPSWVPGPDDQTPGIYSIASLSDDYLVAGAEGWELNSASTLVQLIDCVQPADTLDYSTSYSNAIAEAQHELDEHGRGNVQDVIVFLSDGAANVTPRYVPDYIDTVEDRARPCQSGIKAAAQAKARGTIVYTIGYDLNGFGTDYERCRHPVTQADEGITAFEAMRQIATETDHFYNKPDPGQLNTIFVRIAADLQRPAARLIDDGLQ
jgi:Flp pilus assembly protein TadG